jgi:hypothetical protein
MLKGVSLLEAAGRFKMARRGGFLSAPNATDGRLAAEFGLFAPPSDRSQIRREYVGIN